MFKIGAREQCDHMFNVYFLALLIVAKSADLTWHQNFKSETSCYRLKLSETLSVDKFTLFRVPWHNFQVTTMVFFEFWSC